MKRVHTWLPQRLRDESGQGLVEYAAIVSLMALAFFYLISQLGDWSAGIFRTLVSLLEGIAGGGAAGP